MGATRGEAESSFGFGEKKSVMHRFLAGVEPFVGFGGLRPRGRFIPDISEFNLRLFG